MGRLVRIYVARDTPHGALEDSGIDAEVGNEELQMGLGELPAFSTAPVILVDESNAHDAILVRDEGREGARPPGTRAHVQPARSPRASAPVLVR